MNVNKMDNGNGHRIKNYKLPRCYQVHTCIRTQMIVESPAVVTTRRGRHVRVPLRFQK